MLIRINVGINYVEKFDSYLLYWFPIVSRCSSLFSLYHIHAKENPFYNACVFWGFVEGLVIVNCASKSSFLPKEFSWFPIPQTFSPTITFRCQMFPKPTARHLPVLQGYYKDTVEFYFESRDECKNFWKKCIEHHAFFRCQAVKKAQRRKTRVVSKGSSFRWAELAVISKDKNGHVPCTCAFFSKCLHWHLYSRNIRVPTPLAYVCQK